MGNDKTLNTNILNTNIPTLELYTQLTSGTYFQQFLNFSDSFLNRNQKFLVDYFGKWGRDPLNQWSRKWEYPFTYFQIEKIIEEISVSNNHSSSEEAAGNNLHSISILDAGSGITFFPYFLKNYYQNIDITAFDYDESYIPVFRELNETENSIIEFVNGRLDKMPFGNASFDIIYCISTLEHTENYGTILDEFHRVLKPNGKLILTFDVSELDSSDIPVPQANNLHKLILAQFEAHITKELNPISQNIFQENILTSKWAYKKDPNLIWNHNVLSKIRYFLGHLLKRHSIRFFPDNLTVFCEVYTKK
jgi:ubiquinone/menaquinone biosynthesis C-methylase UbiE